MINQVEVFACAFKRVEKGNFHEISFIITVTVALTNSP